MLRRALLLLPLLSACVDFDRPSELDPVLERRIAQKLLEVSGAPADPRVETELAELYFEAQRYFDAADHFQAASTKSGDIPRVASGLALTYLELGYIPAMVEQLKRCFDRDRNYPGCLYAFANLLERDGSPDALAEARRTYLRFLQVASPDHPKVAYVKSALEQLNARLPKDTTPLAPLEIDPPPPGEAQPLPPGHPSPGGDPALPAGHPTTGGTAVPAHTQASGDEDVGELNAFGKALQKAMDAATKNDFPAAEAAFREAVALRQDDAGAKAGLAETLHAQGKIPEAKSVIDQAQKLDAQDPQVRYTFGLIMISDPARQKEALTAWESLLLDEPGYAAQLKLSDRIAAARKGK